MVTEFGKELRKLRLDLGITLFEMAKGIGVSSSFLSSVETGKKPVPHELLVDLARCYNLAQQTKTRLTELADKTRKEVQIKLAETDASGTELATAFARSFSTLTDDQKLQIQAILNRKDS